MNNTDDVVAQASAIQDLFKQNDAAQVQPDPSTQPADAQTQPPQPQAVVAAAQPDPTTVPPAPDQKSPLDILEEILSKEEKKNAVVAQEVGPTPEELQMKQQLQQQEQAMIEEARLKMMTETQTDEQKKRDSIRQQQIDSNKTTNPFAIRQLEHKKINR